MMRTGATNEWYMLGGGAEWVEKENKGYTEIIVRFFCLVFFFSPYDRTGEKCENNTLQFMER